MTTTTFQFTFPGVGPGAPPLLDMVARLHHAYTHPLHDSFQELWTSSNRIVQQEAAKAAFAATQQSWLALARNAAEVQQRTFLQLCAAHQQACAALADCWTAALAGGLAPYRR